MQNLQKIKSLQNSVESICLLFCVLTQFFMQFSFSDKGTTINYVENIIGRGEVEKTLQNLTYKARGGVENP